MRIMVAFEDEYRAFRDAIADAFRILRPDDEVETVDLDALGERLEHFDPHLVVASASDVVDPVGRAAWVELSQDPNRPSRVCVGDRRLEASNPSMEDLLSVAEEAEALVRAGQPLRHC